MANSKEYQDSQNERIEYRGTKSKKRDYRDGKNKTRNYRDSKNRTREHTDSRHKKRMKLRTQRPSEFSLQRSNEPSSPDTLGSYSEEEEPRGKCKIEDAKTKFSTFFFGLLLMAGGAALLYFGFRPSATSSPTGKTSSDNKLLLTFGFICSMLGMFCFVVSILMFKDVACLYNDNLYQMDENENV